MDNHKLVTISIFGFFFKHEKYAIFVFFMRNMLGKNLEFGRMHENNFFKGKLV
jgi:hypothetical protein